jgi:hypothetical protein
MPSPTLLLQRPTVLENFHLQRDRHLRWLKDLSVF